MRGLIAADLWRMALAGLLPLVDQHLLAVYAVAFGLAAGGVLFNPATSSLLRSVDDDELIAANSRLCSAAVISQIALAPLAGDLVAAVGVAPAFLVNVGVAPAFLVNAASFPASALLAGLHLPGSRRRPRPAPAGPDWSGDADAGSGSAVAAAGAGAAAGRPVGGRPAPCWWCWPAASWRRAGRVRVAAGRHRVGAAFGPLLLARLVSNPRRPALVFGPLLLRGLVDLALASGRSLGRATWSCPAASWTDPHVNLARGAAGRQSLAACGLVGRDVRAAAGLRR